MESAWRGKSEEISGQWKKVPFLSTDRFLGTCLFIEQNWPNFKFLYFSCKVFKHTVIFWHFFTFQVLSTLTQKVVVSINKHIPSLN